MVIRNNVKGQRAQRNYGSTNAAISKTLEKLSTGYRVNSAADDAAGLAVSEKMRLQITGLGRAKENSQAGIGLIQTGEGALQEIHDMLNRAEYLAEESANGTYNDELDRENLQKELTHICEEIDRITASANFNGIELFQDKGVEYERSTTPPDPDAVKYQKYLEELQRSKEQVSEKLRLLDEARQEREEVSNPTRPQSVETYKPADGEMTLDELKNNTKPDELNIVYTVDDTVSTTQTPEGTTAASPVVTDNGQQKKLSDILEREIIPNIVSNVLENYPAFSYLKGSSIGIGLEYFHGDGTDQANTLAYVEVGTSYYTSTNEVLSLSYKLGVNLDQIGTWSEDTRQSLEATIAHEMIHAFMDEATTSGMLGRPGEADGNGNYPAQTDSERFPGWFREGMAQTASGPDNWIHPNSAGGLKLSASSTAEEIKEQLQDSNKELGSDTTASRYGTGYLACMYLGSVIAGNGEPSNTIDAAAISSGLNKLLREVIGGTSLDDAIKKLSNGKFTDMADFETKFNSVDNAPGLCTFIKGLLGATGDGRGGLISGDLTAKDLAPDGEITNINLFKLDSKHKTVENVYPSNYPILSGGTVSKPGVAPPDFVLAQEYGDFMVTAANPGDVSFDEGTGKLIISGSGDVTITMRDGVTNSAQSIELKGTGKVTLDGVDISGNIDIKDDTQVTVTGVNKAGRITMDGDKNATFEGGGRLETGAFASNDTNNITLDRTTLAVTGGNLATKTLTIKNGTVIANSGSGTISGNVTVNGAAVVAGTLSSPPTPHEKADIPWSNGANNIAGLGDLASITIDGVKFDTPIAQNTAASLLLDPSSDHKVTFTDATTRKELVAKPVFEADNVTFKEFTWGLPPRPFTVTKMDGSAAVEGDDFEYDADGTTLIIKKSGELTISGGVNIDDPMGPIKGRIKLENNIVGEVKLKLNGCNVDVSDIEASALDLGSNNTVKLELASGASNTFRSGSNYAGIAVGTGTALTIDSADPGTSNGKLFAYGGSSAAGIGANYDTTLTDAAAVGNSITINGGDITAYGGNQGAGIGAGYQTAFGDITINGGSIMARGNSMSAGIGGGNRGNIHDIKITNCDKIDTYASAGVGIGTGTSATGRDIIITGGKNIKAVGGASAAGIGPDLNGWMRNIEITGGEIEAVSGTRGAGIGGGPSAHVEYIIISGEDTKIKATGGQNGVGIGTGYDGSTCKGIFIKGGTIWAEGAENSTGIGAGRNSSCGNIQIGDPDNLNSKIIVNARGGMTNNGGNILTYTDTGHKNPGTVNIFGQNTSVCPGEKGEGLYSTSGVTDSTGQKLYSYPLYINGAPPAAPELEASQGLGEELGPLTDNKSWGKLPLLPATDGNGNPISIVSIEAKGADGTITKWSEDITHVGANGRTDNYVYLWMSAQDQDLTITYSDGSSVNLHLKFYDQAGKFRVEKAQKAPEVDKEPGYSDDPEPNPDPEPTPGPNPRPPVISDTDDKPYLPGKGGIILQIGANSGEIMEVPRFFLSARALGMDKISIATQDQAMNTVDVLREAVNRVSHIRGSYGALQNRLEHNINAIGQAEESITDAESRIRDADMAEEYTKLVKLNILQQSAQAMMVHSNEDANRVLQMLQ